MHKSDSIQQPHNNNASNRPVALRYDAGLTHAVNIYTLRCPLHHTTMHYYSILMHTCAQHVFYIASTAACLCACTCAQHVFYTTSTAAFFICTYMRSTCILQIQHAIAAFLYACTCPQHVFYRYSMLLLLIYVHAHAFNMRSTAYYSSLFMYMHMRSTRVLHIKTRLPHANCYYRVLYCFAV